MLYLIVFIIGFIVGFIAFVFAMKRIIDKALKLDAESRLRRESLNRLATDLLAAAQKYKMNLTEEI